MNKAEGIVIKTIRYSESQLVLHLFTKSHGRMAAIVRRNRKKGSSNYFQPLFLLSFEMNYSARKSMQRISQPGFVVPYVDIPFSVVKSAVAQFLAEILSQVIPEHEPDAELYNFLSTAFQLYDRSHQNIGNFHLVFLIKLTRFLGFYPGKKTHSQSYFSPSEGTFVPQIMHDTMPDHLGSAFDRVLEAGLADFHLLQLDAALRNQLLSQVLNFYKAQLNVHHLKSYEVLKTVFNS